MKPTVFLSHSKSDKELVEKLANDLRACSIDCWYDEWEIPPGNSIKKKIFEDGIPNCDAFFVYLSEASLSSYWVEKELDAAAFQEAENKQSIMLPFVEKEEIRSDLPLDLKSISCPVLNEDEYEIPFGKLISKVWDVFYNNREKKLKSEHENQTIRLENKILKLEKRLNFDSSDSKNLEEINEILEEKNTVLFDNVFSYKELLNKCKTQLATGITISGLREYLDNSSNSEEITEGALSFGEYDPFDIKGINKTRAHQERLKDVIGEFIIWDLVEMQTSDQSDYVYLTDKGKSLVKLF